MQAVGRIVGQDGAHDVRDLAGLISTDIVFDAICSIGIGTNSNIDASDDIACCRRKETGGIEVVCRNRNIVLDRNHRAVVQLQKVAVLVRHHERLGDVHRHRYIGIVARRIDRQMVDLVDQRERERAGAVHQLEHDTVAVAGRNPVDLGRAHNVPSDRKALRLSPRRHALNEAGSRQRHRPSLVRADVHQRQNIPRRVGRRDRRMTGFRIANALRVVQPVLIYRLRRPQRRVVDRNVVLDRNREAA